MMDDITMENSLELVPSGPNFPILSDSGKDMCFLLIAEVEKHEELFNASHQDYKDSAMTQRGWHEVGVAIGVESDECRRKWYHLRDTYRRTKKRFDDMGGESNPDAYSAVSWRYFRPMNFLSEHTRKQRRNTNVPFKLPRKSIHYKKRTFGLHHYRSLPPYTPILRSPVIKSEDCEIVDAPCSSEYNRPSFSLKQQRLSEQHKRNQSCNDSLPTIAEVTSKSYISSSTPNGSSSSHWNEEGTSTQNHNESNQEEELSTAYTSWFSIADTNSTKNKWDHNFRPYSSSSSPTMMAASSTAGTCRNLDDEADRLFVQSVAVSLSRYPARLKAVTKVEIQKVLLNAEEAFEQIQNPSTNG